MQNESIMTLLKEKPKSTEKKEVIIDQTIISFDKNYKKYNYETLLTLLTEKKILVVDKDKHFKPLK
jgi:wobble nucleotide-excising tRNase